MRQPLETIVRKAKALAGQAWFGSTERERWCLLVVALLLILGAGFKLLRLGGVV